jgi:hypothetical protein
VGGIWGEVLICEPDTAPARVGCLKMKWLGNVTGVRNYSSIMRRECPECGYIFDDPAQTVCPKCDTGYRHNSSNQLHLADIAHHGEDWLDAQRKIDTAIDHALYHRLKGVKIVHGHGGYGHTTIIKGKAVPYLKSIAARHGYKVVQDKFTDGAHILYFSS